jgi:hypothetical protein
VSGQHGHEIRVAAGGNELLGAVDLVTGNIAGRIRDRFGLGFQRGQVAAGFRFGHGIGHQDPPSAMASHFFFCSSAWRRPEWDRCPAEWRKSRSPRPGRFWPPPGSLCSSPRAPPPTPPYASGMNSSCRPISGPNIPGSQLRENLDAYPTPGYFPCSTIFCEAGGPYPPPFAAIRSACQGDLSV